jgi:beta-barrel assembly-enhancing protease
MRSGHSARVRRCFVIILAFQLVCAGVSLPGSQKKEKKVGGGLNFFSPQEEIAMGRRYSQELNAKLNLIDDPEITRYIQDMGSRLVEQSLRRDLEYHYFVVNTRELNAFALPGGFIYVNRALIEAVSNESELAGVVGHEIGHVVGRHSLKQMSKQLLFFGIVAGATALVSIKSERWAQVTAALGGIGVFFAGLKYSRDDEREADLLGLQEMSGAGFDPAGMVSFFEKLDRERKEKRGGPGLAFLSTHPLPAERARTMKAEADKLSLPVGIRVSSARTLEECKARLAAVALPPPAEDKTLGSALASLDDNAAEPSRAEAISARGREGETRSLAVPGDTVWLDTGIDVGENQLVEFTASGIVYYKKKSNESCDPWGAPGTSGGFWKPLSKVSTGALIARVGPSSSTAFPVGAHRIFPMPAAGRLYLGINDDNNFDNRGSYEVQITVYR